MTFRYYHRATRVTADPKSVAMVAQRYPNPTAPDSSDPEASEAGVVVMLYAKDTFLSLVNAHKDTP